MQSGLLNTYHRSVSTRGTWGWLVAVILFAFYILLYFTSILNPLAGWLGIGSKWNIYGILYTAAILIGGVYFLRRHGNSRYHRIRTISVMFFQTVFAFSIPLIMEFFEYKGFVFSIFWPLKIDYFYPSYIFEYPLPLVLYAFLTSLIFVPLISFLIGKRWYCSWVCGCGGLAETAGEPFRHLSSKRAKAWKFEQYAINGVLLFAVITTVLIIINWSLGRYDGTSARMVADYPVFSAVVFKIQGLYGFVIVALLSGVFGVGLYPLLGNRVWCRFFCPLAGLMGLIQKFGRFRITVKDDMCISCGNCSAYCEMGIDVRMYAQNNKSFQRAACVGCGICAHLCPRGVLKLENKWDLGPVVKDTNIRIHDL